MALTAQLGQLPEVAQYERGTSVNIRNRNKPFKVIFSTFTRFTLLERELKNYEYQHIYTYIQYIYIYIYVLYITCVSLISQRISRLPQEKHMVHPLKAGRSHAASRAAFNRWFTRASKDWYLVRCAVNENSLVEERIFYLLVRFTSGIFGNDPFHHYQ